MEDVESSNSCTIVVIGLDEIFSTLGVDVKMFHLLMAEVNLFHVIFNLNRVLTTTCFKKGFHIIILYLRLKNFLEKCLVQFQVYI